MKQLLTALALATMVTPSLMAQVPYNALTPAVPFLNFAPGTESTAMGNTGTGSGNDNSLFYNPAKFTLNTAQKNVNISYMPFFSKAFTDAHFTNIEYYTKLNNKDAYNALANGNAVGAALSYYTIGNVFFKDDYGNEVGYIKPHDVSLALSYIKYHGDDNIADNDKLPGWALALSFKGYMSTAMRSVELQGVGSGRNVAGLAAGISYFKQWFRNGNQENFRSFGINIQNLGPKINYYSNLEDKNYLPASFRIGYGETIKKPYGRFNWGIDLSKLLVPTPPITDSAGKVTAGKDYNRSVIGSWVSSFFDAPGGVGEEMREFQLSAGAEYEYADKFLIRAGISFQDKQKGNNSYACFGAGYRINKFGNVFDLNAGYRSALNPTNLLTNQFFITLKYKFYEQ